MKAVSTVYLGLEESPLKLHRLLLRKLSSPLWLHASVWPLLYLQGFMQVHLTLQAIVPGYSLHGQSRGCYTEHTWNSKHQDFEEKLLFLPPLCRLCRGAGFLVALQRCPKWLSKHTFVCSLLKHWPPQLHITLHLRFICAFLVLFSLFLLPCIVPCYKASVFKFCIRSCLLRQREETESISILWLNAID